MSVQEAWNRGNNLVATSILGISGVAFLPEAFTEDKGIDKLDDSLLFILALILVGWYLKGKNRFTRSIMPLVMTLLALAVKIMGVILELGDKEDLGDDLGAVILFVLASLLVFFLFNRQAPANS